MQESIYPQELQIFIREVTERIVNTLDPSFIILAGSFGKESWLYSEDKLISDFEFVFVCKKRWSLKKKNDLLKGLNEQYDYDISLKGYLKKNIEHKVISNYSRKNPGYISLDFYDTFHQPKYLYTKGSNVLNIDCNVKEIPNWEAWRLYVNRIGELLQLECNPDDKNSIEEYYWMKIFESTADAYCIINNFYEKNISRRLELFNREVIDNDKELKDVCKDSFEIIHDALLSRKNHDLLDFDNDIEKSRRVQIINAWMEYFEGKVADQENLFVNKEICFHENYISKKEIQKKYLGFNYLGNKLVSNAIKLMYNPWLINSKFKWYNHNISWKHLILLSISSAFQEQNYGDLNFPKTKGIMGLMISEKRINDLNSIEFKRQLIKYWKILR